MTAKWFSVTGGLVAFGLSACASHNDAVIRASREREARRADPTMERATTTRSKEVERTTSSDEASSSTSTADRKPDAPLTAMDQSNDPEDIRLTAEIRRLLMDESGLSFSAKNVKIISRDRRVTLRGSVTSDERATIVSRARSVAGVTKVDDLLEIK